MALTIDSSERPHNVPLTRGTASVAYTGDIVPEYAAAAERYFGAEQVQAWVEHVRRLHPYMGRVGVQPE